jgi:hypothetical protein
MFKDIIRTSTTFLIGSLLCINAAADSPITAPGTIGPGFTGSWFDPAQSGHGIAIEVLPGQPVRMLASWVTFAPQGGQAWIAGLRPDRWQSRSVAGFPERWLRRTIPAEFRRR